MPKHAAFIALGSNLGERRGNLDRALELLGKTSGIEVIAFSERYLTSPVGGPDQNDFLNMAVKIMTDLAPEELLARLKDIELTMRRKKKPRNHPRVIDLDLIFYGNIVLSSAELVIPHPEAHRREFVMGPISDIEPNLVHPVLKRTVRDILEDIKGA